MRCLRHRLVCRETRPLAGRSASRVSAGRYVGRVTTLPTWAYWLTAVGAPIAGVIGVLYGHRVTRRGLLEVDTWRRREETMRMLRWAADHAGGSNPNMSDIGFAALTALVDSELLQPEDVNFIEIVARAAVDTLSVVGQEYGSDDELVVEVADRPGEV